MKIIDPKEMKAAEFHAYMLGAIAPRPIAFASTIDKEGNPNLSPFSFFNAFGSNPPLIIFSPALRGRDGATKHTLDNVREVGEVVINVVNYSMVQQTSLASTEYAKGINEFIKAGFTPLSSQMVKPFRVKESPVQMECKVREIIQTGTYGGAANLVICEILLMHIHEQVLNADGKIDQAKIDLVARMGGDWYSRSAEGMFMVPKPNTKIGLGMDNLPEHIRNSTVLTGNDLGMLANAEQMPTEVELIAYRKNASATKLIAAFQGNTQLKSDILHKAAQELLAANNSEEAWKVLML